MANVLTTESTIYCDANPAHGGTITPSSSSKLTVNKKGVVLQADLLKPVSECSYQKTSNPPGNCKQVTSVTPASVASKLKVGGNGVLLDAPLRGNAAPNGTLHATGTQSKLKAI